MTSLSWGKINVSENPITLKKLAVLIDTTRQPPKFKLNRSYEKEFKRTLLPPADQWLTIWAGFVLLLIATVTNSVLSFFTNLAGTPWICCYFSSLAIAITGASLIFYAKLPLYRQRRFFTFGSRALPIERRPFYRWGYRWLPPRTGS